MFCLRLLPPIRMQEGGPSGLLATRGETEENLTVASADRRHTQRRSTTNDPR